MTKRLILLALCLFIASPALAAIAIVGSSTGYSNSCTACSSLTVSVTVGSGADFLVCGIHSFVDGDGTATGVTYNTTETLTQVRQDLAVSGGRDPASEIWYLVAPSVTTANVAITLATTNHVAAATCLVLSGVDQTTPMDETGGEGSVDPTGVSHSDTIDTATANAWVFQSVSGKGAAAGITQDNGQTELTDTDTAGAAETLAWSDAYLGPIATPGTNTLGVSSMFADDICLSLAAIKPAAAATRRVMLITKFYDWFLPEAFADMDVTGISTDYQTPKQEVQLSRTVDGPTHRLERIEKENGEYPKDARLLKVLEERVGERVRY